MISSFLLVWEVLFTNKGARAKGFFVTITVSIGGAVIIGRGIIAMFIGKENTSYVITDSGVITGFILSSILLLI